MSQYDPKRVARLPLALILLALSCSLAAAEPRYAFDVEAGPLETVLAEIAGTAGVAIVFEADVSGAETSAVRGRYSLEDALEQALSETGLQYRRSGEGRIVIEAGDGSSDAAFRLPLTVEASRELADGPVEGYRASRTATATRTDTAISNIPASVQVIGQQQIREQEKRNLSEVLSSVSGVSSGEGSTLIESRENVVARGFTNRSVYYDGFRVSAIPSADLAGIERVEVLKGPASILFGQVEPGGVVNLVPGRAGPRDETEIRASGGEFSERRLTGELNQASESGRRALRADLAIEDSGSFRDRVDVERGLIRPSARIEIGDSATLEAGLVGYREERTFDEGVSFTADGAPPGDVSTYLGGPDLAGSDFEWDGARLGFEYEPARNWRFNAGVFHQRFRHEWEAFRPQGDPGESPLDRGQLAVLTGRSLNDVPSRPVSDDELFRFYDDARLEVDTTEVRSELVHERFLAGLDHTLLLGVDYRREERRIDEVRGVDLIDDETGEFLPQKINILDPEYDAPVPTQFVASGFLDGSQEEYGVLLQDQATIGERWHLLAGLRYDRVDQRAVSDRAQDRLQAEITSGGTFSRFDDSDDAFSGRFGALYRLFDSLAVYASYSESFAATGVKESGDSDELLEPTEGEQIEFGLKAEPLGDRLSATLSVYRIDRTNVPIADPQDRTRFINGGEQRSEGVELDLAGEPLPGWQVQAAGSFIDAEVRDSSTLDRGTPLRNVPDYTVSIASRYRFSEWPLPGLEISGHLVRVAERPGDDEASFELPAYTTFSLFVGRDWKIGDQTVTARLGVKNLWDETHYLASNSRASVVPGPPRSVVGTLGVQF
ncbi:MAG: TonB-dependent receptor [Spiribacter salinus]|uniref:TonB-dependent receptor n=1 Tax=Spiribacter salinus TaxID=1335746 RepID=A0A540VRE2_9GAMM|nr:MAG: TonB-dependent receptor [Spiribacter salinus]